MGQPFEPFLLVFAETGPDDRLPRHVNEHLPFSFSNLFSLRYFINHFETSGSLGSIDVIMQISRIIYKIYAELKRGEGKCVSFLFQVFDANEIAFLFFCSPPPYFKSKAGGYSTYIQGNIRPTEDKTKIKPSRVRGRKKVHVSMVGEEVGIIGKKGEKASLFLAYVSILDRLYDDPYGVYLPRVNRTRLRVLNHRQ